MSRIPRPWLAFAACLIAAVAGTGSTIAAPVVAPAPLARGWGWLLLPGTAAAVNGSTRTIKVAVSGEGRAEIFEGGTAWRHEAVTGTQVVHLLPETVLADADHAPVSIAAIRPGTPLLAWGVVRPDASAFGITVVMPQLHARASAATPAPTGASGVVMRFSGRMLELLTQAGARKSVIVTGTTAVHAAGGGAAPGISPNDLVNVEGTINSDGSVSATRIDVALAVATAPQVSGGVAQRLDDVEGLVVAGVPVAVSGETYFVRGSDPATFKQCAPGQAVTVYGTPITIGSQSVGLRAALVVLR
jgi:hypothetical protein